MLRVDAKIAALPMTMPSQNMKRLVNRRARPHRVINELERKGREQKNCCRKVEGPFFADHRAAPRNRLDSVFQKAKQEYTILAGKYRFARMDLNCIRQEGLIRVKI